ncbi:sialidase family protein [Allorhizocola rhizosphaerae]|uniref:sialidase family protein n=1 Tax=Allorhizocola rhizosphaerae TaxID=1872709 RepID=UPI000E3CEE33|nr:sialidase family protein [Allorhizocola rhizosphaerae]
MNLLATVLAVTLLNPVAVDSGPIFEEQTLFKQREAGYFCFRIPAIVKAGNGDLLAFAEGRVVDCGDDGDIDLVMKRSTDGGRTWGPVQVVDPGNGSTHGNPVPIVDEASGRVVLVTTRNGPEPCPNGCDRDPWVLHSDDHGATWSAPREIAKDLSWNHWYATGPMHGIQLRNGRLVVGASHESFDGTRHVYGTHLLVSDDAGLTWRVGASAQVDDGTIIAQEVTVFERSDGAVYALARERGTDPGHRAYAVSSDGGLTFDAPFRIVRGLEMPDVQASTLKVGNRVLLSSPAHPVAREVMSVRSSWDDGRTWETWQEGKVIHWGPTAYSDLVAIGGLTGLLYEAGNASPYESIRFARFNDAYLKTPNATPPGIPAPPEPGPTTPSHSRTPAYVRGGASLVDGRFGKGMAFDRVDDRIEVPFDESIDVAGDDFTMMTWLRYSATSGSHAILWAYRVGSGTTPQIWLRAEPASNRIRALIMVDRFNVSVQSTRSYNDGQWHHVVLQRANGRFVLSVDGVEVGATSVPPGSVTAGKEFGVHGIHIGQRIDGVDRLLGALDEVRVYRRALHPTELDLIRTHNLPIGGRLGLRLPLESIA